MNHALTPLEINFEKDSMTVTCRDVVVVINQTGGMFIPQVSVKIIGRLNGEMPIGRTERIVWCQKVISEFVATLPEGG